VVDRPLHGQLVTTLAWSFFTRPFSVSFICSSGLLIGVSLLATLLLFPIILPFPERKFMLVLDLAEYILTNFVFA